MSLDDEDRALNALLHADLADALPFLGLSYFSNLFAGRKEVAKYIQQFTDKEGDLPTVARVKRKFSKHALFPRPVKPEPLKSCIDDLREEFVETVITDRADKMKKAFESGQIDKFLEISRSMDEDVTTIQRPIGQSGLDVSALTKVQLANLDKDAALALKTIPTGFPPMDKELGGDGASPGMLIVLSALISLGKTYVLCQIAENMRKAGYNVLLVPLEMSAESIQERCMCIRYNLNVNHYIKKEQPDSSKDKGESREDWYRSILQHRMDLEKKDKCTGKVIIETSEGLTTTRDIRNWAKRHGADVVLIDAAQDIQPGSKCSGRTEGIYQSLAELNNIARDFMLPIFMSVQLSAEVEKKSISSGTLVHIQWGQAYAQKAHAVFRMLGDRSTCERDICTDKNRDGIPGSKWEINMKFPNVHIEGRFLQTRGLVDEGQLFGSADEVMKFVLEGNDDADEDTDADESYKGFEEAQSEAGSHGELTEKRNTKGKPFGRLPRRPAKRIHKDEPRQVRPSDACEPGPDRENSPQNAYQAKRAKQKAKRLSAKMRRSNS